VHESDITNMKSTQAQTATAADATCNLLSFIHSFIHYFTHTHKYSTSHNVRNLGSNLCTVMVSQHDNIFHHFRASRRERNE